MLSFGVPHAANALVTNKEAAITFTFVFNTKTPSVRMNFSSEKLPLMMSKGEGFYTVNISLGIF
ncbi:hypothetical protein bcgnr5406_04880 [Bacillus cereus]